LVENKEDQYPFAFMATYSTKPVKSKKTVHTPLKNGDQVEIISGKHEVPNREWLAEGLGYVTTARARSKIQQWFRQQDSERHLIEGSMLLDREFKSNLDWNRITGMVRVGASISGLGYRVAFQHQLDSGSQVEE